MNKVLKNKWHLHSLTLVLSIVFLFLTDEYPGFMSIGETGNFLQVFLSVFGMSFLAFLVEWIEGAVFGANSTLEEAKDSDNDMFVSIIFGITGTALYFMFPGAALWMAGIFSLAVIGAEVYRQFHKQ